MKKWWLVTIFLGIAVALLIMIYQTSQYSIEGIEKYKVGVLISGSERMEKVEGLQDGLKRLGFVDGTNIEYIIKNGNNDRELMKKYADQLNKMNLNVIVAGGTIETKYLKEDSNSKIPIVFLGVADAIHLHLVESYQKPNGRITGVENGHVELSGKRLQLFKFLIPSLKRIIVVYDHNIEASRLSLSGVESVAKGLNVPILPVSVSDNSQLLELQAYPFQDNDGILVLPSYYLEEISSQMGKIALEQDIPIFGVNLNDVRQGYLMSYGISYYDQGNQSASMVSQILNGLDPGQIPVEKPDTIQLLVNQETENTLNIHFSNTGNAFIHRVTINSQEDK